ncbi:hypothetical protein GCM10027578_35990 [Spirosoma luteolum]
MQTKLIDGHFSAQDALSILTQMVHVKVRFHEAKISASCQEEDIKARERRIKELQQQLFRLRQFIEQHGADGICLHADLVVETPSSVLAAQA